MAMRFHPYLGIATVAAVFLWMTGASAQNAALRPIPAAECQTFAGQLQGALGFAAKAEEDDFTDLTDRSEGRSCHISASASNQAFGAPAELISKLAPVFGGWQDDPARAESGPAEADKGFVNGSRIATVEVSWEPGPGASCSDKQPLSACNITPQQKLWNVMVDIVEKGGK
ncbi:MAG TPA: hypothetical protein VGR70_07940 [Stellaceae bacterium]|nr:hypothetical protein [Stellaceae bacterium]